MDLYAFFDRLEDSVRGALSRRPVLFGLVAGVGSVFFFRGLWLMADEVSWLTGPVTFAISLLLLLLSGAFVTHFVSAEVIVSGRKGHKKLIERSVEELRAEPTLKDVERRLGEVEGKIDELLRR